MLGIYQLISLIRVYIIITLQFYGADAYVYIFAGTVLVLIIFWVVSNILKLNKDLQF